MALKLLTRDNFGECCHTPATEPFYYETAYKHNFMQHQSIIDRTKRCVVSKDLVLCSNEYMSYESPIVIDENGKALMPKHLGDNKWECSPNA